MGKLQGILNRFFLGWVLFCAGTVDHACADTNVVASTISSNTLSIYLVKTRGTNLNDMVLAPEPLLSDHDFVAYNIKTHEFAITPKAAARMDYNLGGLNMPFVMVANGQRIYLGDFKNLLSSQITVGCPTIDFCGKQTGFRIESAIQLGAKFPPDMRNDPRILSAVEQLFGKSPQFGTPLH